MAENNPNIIWMLTEDQGKHLGCYGTPQLRTPNIDRFASQGVRFDHAYCTAPVCSPSRSAMITGMYQTSINCQNHRSHATDGWRLPAPVKPITSYLRDAGYFCANGNANHPIEEPGKSDFNFANRVEVWDGTHYSQRKAGQPFFQQMNFWQVHRGLWPEERKQLSYRVDPNRLKLPPYYPDTPVARDDYACYMDMCNLLDIEFGILMKRLEADGVLDNTILILQGDNGSCNTRGKQWLYEGGISVPLIVHCPSLWRGAQVDKRLVSSIDVSASVLSLAGVTPPAYMEGRPHLLPGSQGRDYCVAARDRCDETLDHIRAVVDHRYKYIRNYCPDRPYTQDNQYIISLYPVLGELKRLKAEGKLNKQQAAWMSDTRPVEELYDLRHDPWEVNNLAQEPKLRMVLDTMRRRLHDWQASTKDYGEAFPGPE
ncbi:MAG: sulfatase family protein [Armatimonadota bacterium]